MTRDGGGRGKTIELETQQRWIKRDGKEDDPKAKRKRK